jgi:hypothetical protein
VPATLLEAMPTRREFGLAADRRNTGGTPMTEQEWLDCGDPRLLLEFLRGKASDRKLRLFAVACCRLSWPSISDERSRRAVQVAEEFAEQGQAAGFLAARLTAGEALSNAYGHQENPWLTDAQSDAACRATNYAAAAYDTLEDTAISSALKASDSTVNAIGCADDGQAEIDTAQDVLKQKTIQSAFVRDIFGNPFRPLILDPAWLSFVAVSIAQAIYAELAFDRLPILADALEDAGCDNADILNHCRLPGDHARGCWVLDLLLGKE